ncbi:MAG: hypothetical protein KGN84_15435 [Acidobacteriota bacterium]|nr:hypothetical protein [Acidobacteriota bacterium]
MPSSDPRLSQFIDAAKTRGASDEGLAAILSREGWPASQIYGALGEYWARVSGIAVPQRARRGESSREAFLYLLAFSTLATWAGALGSLLFDLINYWLPDAAVPVDFLTLRASVTWRMACLAVTFPIYILATSLVVRETRAEPERLQSGVRKWLTWIALLLTAGGMIGDLICFLDYFLTGEVTLRFLLKCLVVLAMTGAIFAYYVKSLAAPKPGSRELLFGIGASAAAAAVFIGALFVAGTPGAQRQTETDQRRVEDLRQIASAVFVYHAQNSVVPPSLDEPLIRRRLGTIAARDPETSLPYEYRPTAGTKYELCAVFSATSTRAASFWNHPAGRSCFDLDASRTAPY